MSVYTVQFKIIDKMFLKSCCPRKSQLGSLETGIFFINKKEEIKIFNIGRQISLSSWYKKWHICIMHIWILMRSKGYTRGGHNAHNSHIWYVGNLIWLYYQFYCQFWSFLVLGGFTASAQWPRRGYLKKWKIGLLTHFPLVFGQNKAHFLFWNFLFSSRINPLIFKTKNDQNWQ